MKRAIVLSTLPLLAACSLFSGPSRQGEPVQQSVMSLWDLYRDCRGSRDVERTLSAARELRQSANLQPVTAAELPAGLDGFVSKQPVRTTVDPKAMAASCTLQAARASMEAGRHEQAQQLLYAVMRSYPESEYAFYVERAKGWMKDMPAVDSPLEPVSASEL
jgi:hypothetical protein